MTNAPKVFISYSHDSDEHRAAVLALSNRLLGDGFDCHIDQYEVAPPDGWSRWMERHIEAAEFVLVVCTPTYRARFDGNAPAGTGRGVKWESMLTRAHLYEHETVNQKFVPVLFRGSDEHSVPRPLFDVSRYELGQLGGYDALLRRLLRIPGAHKPDRGDINAAKARLGLTPIPQRQSKWVEEQSLDSRGAGAASAQVEQGDASGNRDSAEPQPIANEYPRPEAIREGLIDIIKLPAVASVLREKFGCEPATSAEDLADVLIDRGQRDAADFTLRLQVAATELRDVGDTEASSTLKRKPFGSILQLLFPHIVQRICHRADDELAVRTQSFAYLEAVMAREGLRKAYWSPVGAGSKKMVGSQAILPQQAVIGWDAKQGVRDIAKQLAGRLGHAFPDEDEVLQDEVIDELDRMLERDAKKLALFSPASRQRYEKELHPFYAPVVADASGPGNPLLRRLRQQMPNLKTALIEAPGDKRVRRTEKDVEDNIFEIFELEATAGESKGS